MISPTGIGLSVLTPLIRKICASPSFRRSPRLQRFLEYILENAISNPGHPLKEFQIATAVFDKDESFDPQLDPIVRVEAGRLRLRLLEYYSGAGQNDSLIIEIPKGGYTPTFHVLEEVPSRADAARPVNPAAHRLGLKGRYLWGRRGLTDLTKSAEYFRQAVALDATYAEGYAGLADTYLILGTFGFIAPTEARAKAKAAAAAALEIDAGLSAAQTTLACVAALYEWDWKGAEASFRRAISSNTGYAPAQQWLGACLMIMGRFGEGLHALRVAQELEPLALMAETQLAAGFHIAGKHAQAEEACRAALELDANFWPAHYFLGLTYEQEELSSQAIAELQLARDLSGKNALTLASLGHAYARAGSAWETVRISDELRARSTECYVPPFSMALLQAGFGKKDECFAALYIAGDERSPLLSLWLTTDPRLQFLRSDERYGNLTKKIGLDAVR